jgi:hypothetical protein
VPEPAAGAGNQRRAPSDCQTLAPLHGGAV